MKIEVEGVSKSFGPVAAVADVNLCVPAGQTLAVVGPSGCGKTTLLRLIAGLEHADRGTIRFAGGEVALVPPWKRNVAMAFQRPALVAGRTVRWHLGAAVDLAAASNNPKRNEQDRDLLDRLQISGLLSQNAETLSAGQQQRVSLGRTLLRQAPIVLLDEPLGPLDVPLREAVREVIRENLRTRGATGVVVTHDPADATGLATKIAVLEKGAVTQVGSVQMLMKSPGSRFVAEFFGDYEGGWSFVDATVEDGGAVSPLGRFPLQPGVPAGTKQVVLGFTADAVSLSYNDFVLPSSTNVFACTGFTVVHQEPRGRSLRVKCTKGGSSIWAWALNDGRARIGACVSVMICLERTFWFDSTTGKTLFPSTA